MSNHICNDESSDPQRLRSMEFVEESIQTEVKEIKQRQREARIRSLTDVSLMLLMIMVAVLAWLWLM